MAPLRQVDPTGLYHVMSRGNFRQTIFFDDDHFGKYTQLLDRVTRRRGWVVLDWCLIPNHYHLLIQLTDGGLSDGMRELNGCYSRWSNLRTRRTRTGHLLHNRFTSRAVVREGHFWALASYIPLNPVRAGLVVAPEDWQWSGFRATIGAEHPFAFHRPAELLRYFASDPVSALARYRRHVHDALAAESAAGWERVPLGEPLQAPS